MEPSTAGRASDVLFVRDSDTISLLGTIGTWVAVFFAVLALVSIVSPILAVKASHSDYAIALSEVDDPSHKYVGRGLPIYRGHPIFRSVHAPALKAKPNIKNIVIDCDIARLVAERSQTRWISFATALGACGRMGFKNSGRLVVENQETFLETHRDWFVVLGVLGRYARREDSGLPPPSVSATALTTPAIFGQVASHNPSAMLSGHTGTLLFQNRSSRTHRGTPKVYFDLHSSNRQHFLEKNDIGFRDLLLRFLGFIPAAGGRYFAIESLDFYVTESDLNPCTNSLVSPKPEELRKQHRYWLGQLGVEASQIYQLRKFAIKDMDKTALDSIPLEKMSLITAAINLEWSPRGFLFGSSVGSEVEELGYTRRYFFDTISPSSLLDSVPFTRRLAAVKEFLRAADPLSLGDILDKVSQTPHLGRSGFSRTTCRDYYDLDLALREVGADLVAVAYVMYNDIHEADLNPDKLDQKTRDAEAELKVEENLLRIPSLWLIPSQPEPTVAPSSHTASRPEPTVSQEPAHLSSDTGSAGLEDQTAEETSFQDFYFPATKLFNSESMEHLDSKISYATFIEGCLLGHLRAEMFRVILPGSHLFKWHSNLQKVVWVASTTNSLNSGDEDHPLDEDV